MFRTRIRILIVATALATATVVSLVLYFLVGAIVIRGMQERVMALASVLSAGMDKNRIIQLSETQKPNREQADFIYLNHVLVGMIRDTTAFTNPIAGASILVPTRNNATSGFDVLVASDELSQPYKPFNPSDDQFRFNLDGQHCSWAFLSDESGSWITGYSDIRDANEKLIGMVEIHLDRVVVQWMLLKLFLIVFVFGFGVIIVASFLSDRIVVRLLKPLELINNAIQKIAQGYFDTRLAIDSPKDFLILSKNINQMVGVLKMEEILRKEANLMQLQADQREEHDLLIKLLEEQLSKVTDVDLLLTKILNSALDFSKCEAGSIWIMDQGQLALWYARNLVLEARVQGTRGGIVNARIPISSKSIAGHCALTMKQVVLDDVYHLPDDSPFQFDQSFDQKIGFRTRCMISIPLLGAQGSVLGVMQLINPDDHETVTNAPIVDRTSDFAILAGQVLERANNARDLLMRLVRTAEVRDPHETGMHVQRVSGVACHLYKILADKSKMPPHVRDQNISVLRVAAFLHDIGKVGIPDAILKKPGKLDETEYNLMKWHTVIGAKLFDDSESALEKAASDVALHHQERWDGTGYPGAVDLSALGTTLDELKDIKHLTVGLKGEETSLFARLVGIADVFDALASQRAYKEPWTDEQIVSEISKTAGSHFDPEIVQIFVENYADLKAIRERFQNPRKKPH